MPKLNTPKYVTLQKLIAKIEHCLNIFLYLYSLVCTFFCLTSFLSKTLSITVIHVYTHTSQTEKCSRCEIVGLDDNLNSRCFDLCFVAVLICHYFENTENIAILIISRLNKFYWYCMVFINVLYLPVISLLSSKPTISHCEHFSV
jgi:hypothetical protein